MLNLIKSENETQSDFLNRIIREAQSELDCASSPPKFVALSEDDYIDILTSPIRGNSPYSPSKGTIIDVANEWAIFVSIIIDKIAKKFDQINISSGAVVASFLTDLAFDDFPYGLLVQSCVREHSLINLGIFPDAIIDNEQKWNLNEWIDTKMKERGSDFFRQDEYALIESAKFICTPAGRKHHGAFAGGSILHMLNCFKIANVGGINIIEPKLNELLILFAALTHDVMKLNEYVLIREESKPAHEYQIQSVEFLFDHGYRQATKTLSAQDSLKSICNKKDSGMDGVEIATLEMFEHLAALYATHHGEWALTKLSKNKYKETCQLLHSIDMVESRMDQI